MRNISNLSLTIVFALINLSVCAQKSNVLSNSFIVKSNLLNLIAKRPAITLEKLLSNRLSAEASFVSGEFKNLPFTDYYKYSGVLVRAKRYFIDIEPREFSPYASLYAGTLKRSIKSEGYVDRTGFISYPSKDLSANSVRGGVSLGCAYFEERFVIDALLSLGYGKYTNYKRFTADYKPSGYLDTQVWLSIGYRF